MTDTKSNRPPEPPSIETILGAAVILLQRLVEQTDEIEPLLKKIAQQQQQTNTLLQKILIAVSGPPKPPEKVLTSIKVYFTEQGDTPMPGPIIPARVVLTFANQVIIANIQGYDQFGNPIDTPQNWEFTGDNDAAATVESGSGAVVAVANGVCNVTGSCTADDGTVFSDTEPVTVTIAAETPVLTSVRVFFTQPAESTKRAAPAAPAKRR